MLPMTATIGDISANQYHADRIPGVEQPTLSRSIAHILCTDSPLHAWTAHPKLNPNYKPTEKEEFDIGHVVHDLLLFGGSSVEVVDAENWRTKAAQEARDAARDAGRQPLLPHQWQACEEMADAVRRQLERWEDGPVPFTDGQPEQTIVWDEAGVVCKARPDWIRDDHAAIDDFKTCRSANPDAFTRSLFGYGYDLQAYMYVRGLHMATGASLDTPFRFVAIEKQPPYAVSVVALGPAAWTIARKKYEYAVNLWRECLESSRWPGYEPRVAYAELPAWIESAWLERELREEMTA